MKKQLGLMVIAVGSSFIVSAYAVAPGLYMGLAAGPATANGSTQQLQVEGSPTTTPGNPKSSQFGSRIFVGYDINQYAGIESGIDYYSSIHYRTSDVTTCSSASAQVRDIDFEGKAQLPVKMIDAYTKAGVAVTYITTSSDLNPVLSAHCGTSENLIKYRPIVTFGMSYDLSQNWVVDVSWTRLFINDVISSIDFYALGFSYHFVDKYCGQFLCD